MTSARSDTILRVDVSLRGLLLTSAALVAFILLVRLWTVLVLIAFAFILLAALLPFVGWLMARGLGRASASVLTIGVLLVGIVAVLAITIPSLVIEFANIDENLPVYAREVDDLARSFGAEMNLEQRARDFDLSAYASGSASEISEPVMVAGVSVLTILVLTAHLLVDVPRLLRFVFQFVPLGREAEITALLDALRRVVGGYVRGQAITSACIAVFTFAVLVVVGAPNPLAFAVLAGFADIIPLVGAFLAIVPAVVATLGVSLERALVVLVLLVLYQQFEDRYLVPKVYGSTLGLPPLVVLLVVLAGAQLLGVVGVLLALPAVAAGRVIVAYLQQHGDLVPTFPPPEGIRDEVAAPDGSSVYDQVRTGLAEERG